MKKFKKLIGIIMLAVVMGFSFAACDDGDKTVHVTGVTLDKNSLSLSVDGTANLTATVAPGNATFKNNISWSTSNPVVAYPTMDLTDHSKCVIKAVSAGTATITVITADEQKTATCLVTVTSGGNTAVTFSGVTANGSDSETTTQLTLTFSQAIPYLSADDITLSGVSGVTKGTLSGSGRSYTLDISGFTTSGSLNVTVTKSGYTINGSQRTVNIYYAINVTFINLTANGSTSQTTTQLTLIFSQAITGLSANDIYLLRTYNSGGFNTYDGVNKGTLSGSGPTYTLDINGDFADGGILHVQVVRKSGYSISGSPKTVKIYYNNGGSLTIEMETISAGTFTMGSPSTEPGREDNETQHSVTLSGFSMSKYQVTQEQYQAVMGTNPSNFTSAVTGESGTPGKLPVERVSWYDALVFCNRLSMAKGLSPVYSISGSTDPADWGTTPYYVNDPNQTTWDAVIMDKSKNGYRLPTEAEWEYACRAGTTTAFNNENDDYTNTSSVGAVAWYNNNSDGKTHRVGMKTANKWGLYDMHGNLYEWCWDRYGNYSSGSVNNPTGAVTGARVLRGGSWGSYGSYLRSAFRFSDNPVYRLDYIGFRLVRP